MIAPALNLPMRRDHIIGAVLALAHLAFLMSTHERVGIPRDESFYFDAADRAGAWVERLFDSEVRSFSKAEISRGFEYNHEHPVLMKTLFGVSERFLHQKWGVFDDALTGYRFPTMLMASLAIWLAWLLGVMLQGQVAGVVAALSLAFMPRVMFHSQLACFDAPVTFMWLLIAYCFLRAMRRRRWAIATGFAFGLGLATKLNIFFVPITLAGVAAVDLWHWRRRHGTFRAPKDELGPLTYYGWIIGSAAVLGPVVFFGHWPWLWYETWPRLNFYLSFHLKHVHYPVEYLGTLYWRPPFPVHFPFVYSLFSVPVVTLVLGSIGMWITAQRARFAATDRGQSQPDRRAADAFLLLNIAVPILVIAMPHTPIFGGTKHWMPAMPFLAVAAGIGAERMGQGLFASDWWTHRKREAATLALAALMLVPAAWSTVTRHAHGPAWYNALVGGVPGAASIGMPRNFWGASTIGVLEDVDALTEERALVFWHKATSRAIRQYKQEGRLRKDVRYTGDWTPLFSNWAVYHDQREKLPEEVDIWRAYGTEWPRAGYFIDGVQMMGVYQRPFAPRPPPIPANGR